MRARDEAKVTLEVVLKAAKWASASKERPRKIDGQKRRYAQGVWDCGTACCIWGAACLIAKAGRAKHEPSDYWTRRSPVHKVLSYLLSNPYTKPQEVIQLLKTRSLSGIIIAHCAFTGTDLNGLALAGARFSWCSFTDVDLSGHDLTDTKFIHCSMTNVLAHWQGLKVTLQGNIHA